jgi:hypothetical protein
MYNQHLWCIITLLIISENLQRILKQKSVVWKITEERGRWLNAEWDRPLSKRACSTTQRSCHRASSTSTSYTRFLVQPQLKLRCKSSLLISGMEQSDSCGASLGSWSCRNERMTSNPLGGEWKVKGIVVYLGLQIPKKVVGALGS